LGQNIKINTVSLEGLILEKDAAKTNPNISEKILKFTFTIFQKFRKILIIFPKYPQKSQLF
jgi:hypothetical protein